MAIGRRNVAGECAADLTGDTAMKTFSRFIGTTVLGGVLFLAPIVVLIMILSKAFDLSRRSLKPLAALIPDNLASGPTASGILAILLLAVVCFLAGLLARTMLAQRVVEALERAILSKLPGYEYLKEAGTSVLGLSESLEHPVVLAEFGGSWRVGVQTDAGEGFVSVFIPNSPNPMSGGLFLLAKDRVRAADVPLADAIASLRRCGMGSSPLLAKAFGDHASHVATPQG
jgi:uncharacterized membrane protein